MYAHVWDVLQTSQAKPSQALIKMITGSVAFAGKDDVKAVTKKFNVTFYKTLFTTTWDAISSGKSLASLAKSPKKVLGLIQQFKDLDAAGQGKIVPPGENLIAAGCTAGEP